MNRPQSNRFMAFSSPRRLWIVGWIALWWVGVATPCEPGFAREPIKSLETKGDASTRPNILIVLADDLGFSDLGCYGGEIATPNLDQLANRGVKFSQYYNTARCWPTRACLLTGYYAQQVRRDLVEGVPSGTAGKRPAWAKLLPEHLQVMGYRSYHSGKWHIDGDPRKQGFIHSLDIGGAGQNNYFRSKGNTIDGQPMPEAESFYITDATTDFAIRCLDEHFRDHGESPFFQFVAYTAPHFPLHARAEDIAKYAQRYQSGWDMIRDARHARLKSMGLEYALSPIMMQQGPPYRFPEAWQQLGAGEVIQPKPWRELDEIQRAFQASKMAIHAAMVDRMDWNIGRLIKRLEEQGQLANTLILFLSDNGASAEIMVRGGGHDPQAAMGSEASYLCLGPGWSTAANTPFRLHKSWVHEGGISTPMIVSWPNAITPTASWINGVGHVIDIVPTLLEVAGINQASIAMESQPALPGRSWLANCQEPMAKGGEEYWWLHEGNAALRQGDWKLVRAGKEGSWELYNMRKDRSELRDMASRDPDRVAAMAARWNQLRELYASPQ